MQRLVELCFVAPQNTAFGEAQIFTVHFIPKNGATNAI
jgi:hypothetical protein